MALSDSITNGGALGAAGIGAGASLIGGLLSNLAAYKQKQYEMMQNGIQKGIQGQMDGAQATATGQQSSLAQMLQAMKSAYGA